MNTLYKKIPIPLYVILLAMGGMMYMPFAQSQTPTGAQYCSEKKKHSLTQISAEDFKANPKHTFNVLNYTLNLDIYSCFVSPYPSSYTATNTITFRVDSSLSTIQLNAVQSSLTIDSVALAGVSFTHTSDKLTITLDNTYAPGETTQVKIYYRHKNVTDGAFDVNSGMVFTDCEPEGARKWYPCWDKPSDKATLDLTAKTPGNVILGSNGRLADTTRIDDTLYYHWISRDPVSTYLVVMSAKVNYNLDIVYWHKTSNPNDSVPIHFYYNDGENITTMKTRIITMITLYSQLFGEHPFEKNGFASLNPDFIWGGMENQTLTNLCQGCWQTGLISHEFGHQWFGDMVTCGTWADIWLNEGFATYLEAIWSEHFTNYAAYKNAITSDANSYLGGNPGWAIYNPAWAVTTPDINTLFNTEITYYKGAAVLHMLRYTLGDSLFFAALKSYAMDETRFKFGNAITDDFATKVSEVAGQDMHWFIDEWVKSANHPVYQNKYGIHDIGGGMWQVDFVTKQTQTNSVFHKMPIELKFLFTGSDTTIRVFNDSSNQTFSFTFSKHPTSVQFDPNNNIVLKNASTVLGVNEERTIPKVFSLSQNYPNPFNPVTTIRYTVANASNVQLTVFDVLGNRVAQLVNGNKEQGSYTAEFNGSNLASGLYFYKLEARSTSNSMPVFSDSKKLILLK